MGLDIRTVLFDLDGTIYQNLTFNRIYIRNLTAGTPFASWQESLLAYTEEVFAGRRLIMKGLCSPIFLMKSCCSRNTACFWAMPGPCWPCWARRWGCWKGPVWMPYTACPAGI